ncbi:hypothetical protein QW131_12605 [Roseibium salinum]|nr:hypothetical protein [Roseibium salinum]
MTFAPACWHRALITDSRSEGRLAIAFLKESGPDLATRKKEIHRKPWTATKRRIGGEFVLVGCQKLQEIIRHLRMRRQQIGDPAPVFGHGGRQEVSRQLQKKILVSSASCRERSTKSSVAASRMPRSEDRLAAFF